MQGLVESRAERYFDLTRAVERDKMRRLALGGVVLLAAFAPVVVACDSDAPAATPTQSTTQEPSPTPPSPSTPTSEPPTTMASPPEGHETVAGARAFVALFVRQMNSAWSSKETTELRKLFTDDCISCRNIANGIDGIRRRGGDTQGALWKILSQSPIPLQKHSAPIMHAAISTTNGRWKPSSDSSWQRIPASTSQWDFHLKWVNNQWLLSEAVSQ